MELIMRSLVAIVLLVVTQAPAVAQEIVASSVSTTGLMESCHRAGNQMRMDCAGYIMGVYDQMSLARLICPPRNPNGGTGQAIAVALKFLNEHPEQWHLA